MSIFLNNYDNQNIYPCFLFVRSAFVWCYNFSPCSPPVWPLYFPNCKGTSQSPIDLEDVWAQFNPALGPIKIIGFDESDTFILTNTGHNGRDDSYITHYNIEVFVRKYV